MSKMTDFEALGQLNANDVVNGTRHLKVTTDIVSAEKNGKMCTIKMRIDDETLNEIMNGTFTPVLYVVNRSEFFNIKNLKS